jgi:Na+-transporting methylmalonyl-CoA/oxaloacetate decarboxylase gamma subunit
MGNLSFLFAAGTESEIHPLIVCLIGVSIVFIGLACIIGLVELMTLVCNKILEKGETKKPSAPAGAVQSAPQPTGVVANRGEILAAVCAAVAEEEGTDISAIRVISFKKVQ